MKVVLDLDSHSAIQDFTNRSPVGAYQFKSQDTVEWEVYFVRGGQVQDLGAGFAMKFGMIQAGDVTNTLLAYQTAFTYSTDSDGNVYYSGLVNFNTSQMATAIGTSPSIQGTAEIRYQDSLSEIIHSINIATVVYATILVETGVTPPGVSTGYPDASTIELLVHKNAASGYAGLSSSSLITATQIPVDNNTITVSGGKIASSAILATTTANFTTPAASATVSVTFSSTANLKAGAYVRIPIAGYYIVQSITSGTVAVLQNNGDPFNAASGVTITSGAVALPAQAAAGSGGSPGQNAYTTTLANFTVPTAGTTVNVNMGSTSWLAGSGQVLFIQTAGYYAVSSIPDSTHAVLTNLGYASTNASSGTTITSGAGVSPGGLQGPASTASGANAYDTTQASFTMPAAAASVNITITNTNWLGIGQEVYIAGAGYFSVASIISPTIFSATNSNYPGATAPGSTIASGKNVSPAGVIGPQGAGGPGLNAYTTLTSNFTQPAVNATVGVLVGTTAWMAIGQGIYIAGGGYYAVTAIADLTHATVSNTGAPGNASPGATVTGSGTQMVSPAGVPGTAGASAYTTTSATFTMPASGSSVTIPVFTTAFMATGQNLFVQNAGYFTVATITDGTHVVATNNGASGNTSSGATIPSGSSVISAGANGATGAAGAPGPAGRDGAYSTIYTQYSVSGTGGAGNPAQLVNDAAQGTQAYAIYQRDVAGNNLWGPIPVDGTTVKIVSGKLTAPGSGSSAPFDPRSGVYIYDEFLTQAATPEYQVNSANGGQAVWYDQNQIAKTSNGIVIILTGGSAAAGCCTVSRGKIDSNFNSIVLGNGPFEMAARVWLTNSLGTAMPSTGYAFGFYFGLWQQGSAADITQASNYYEVCAMVWRPDQNSGNLQLVTAPGPYGTTNTLTYRNGTGTVTSGYHWWSMKITAAGDVTMYIDGVSIGVFTGVAPLNQPMVPMFNIQRSSAVSTIWNAYIDALYVYEPYTR